MAFTYAQRLLIKFQFGVLKHIWLAKINLVILQLACDEIIVPQMYLGINTWEDFGIFSSLFELLHMVRMSFITCYLYREKCLCGIQEHFNQGIIAYPNSTQ